eukprot:EC788847.1.p1 GENE.EC788847.1~~EC788847.1.p1  ORF type:complete len:67 (+),score=1.45 EC788847.1:192-392(+)
MAWIASSCLHLPHGGVLSATAVYYGDGCVCSNPCFLLFPDLSVPVRTSSISTSLIYRRKPTILVRE